MGSPAAPLERHFATIYAQCRDSELTKHPWRFARARWQLTANATTIVDTAQKYVYEIPDEVLQVRHNELDDPFRDADDWEQFENTLLSGYSGTLWVEGTKRVLEAKFPPLFNDVLAYRLAEETTEWPGVNAALAQKLPAKYNQAVIDARRQNAFIERRRTTEDDAAFTWLTERQI